MRFPPEFIERVSEANNLVDLISQYTQLKPSGSGLMGRCPFPDHQEKTPSFSVSEVKQVYHCFGCHKSGNIFSFLRDMQGMNFPEAVEYLAQRARLPLPQVDQSDAQFAKERDKKKQLMRINALATQFFIENLKKQSPESPVKKYLKKRGLEDDVVEAFQLGYASEDWEKLGAFLKSKGIPLELAEEVKLMKARREGNGFYDLFRDRLMFPIVSTLNETLAFGGRIIEQGEPKYLNSPESPVFIKGRVLYGLHQTARYIRSEDFCLIVEGYMDLVSLYQAGIQNVAATMGTALTVDHTKVIQRMTKNVVVLFDGDQAGIDAAERSLPILLATDIYPKGLILPDNMDPDDFVKARGAIALKSLIEKAPDLFSLVLKNWMVGYRGEASQKVQLVDKVQPVLIAVKDKRLRDLYMDELARQLGVPLNWLKEALNAAYKAGASGAQLQNMRFNNTQASSSASFRENPSMAPNTTTSGATFAKSNSEGDALSVDVDSRLSLKGASKAEVLLLNLALKSRANIEEIMREQISRQVLHPSVRQLLEKTEETYRQGPDKFDRLLSLFVSQINEPQYLFLKDARNNFSNEFDEASENKLLRDCYQRVREEFFRHQTKKLSAEQLDDEKLKQLMELQKERLKERQKNKRPVNKG